MIKPRKPNDRTWLFILDQETAAGGNAADIYINEEFESKRIASFSNIIH